jgi:hypothetical protein
LRRGNGAGPQWALGEPDFVVSIPRQEIPASGVVD